MQADPLHSMLVGDGPGVDDFLLSFQVDALDVRGRVVRLGPEIDRLLRRHAYPVPVLRVLAEASVLTILLGSALKLDGRFQLQTKSDGPISMLVVDFEAPNRVRAYAQFDAEAIPVDATSADLLGKGHLALTIDQGGDMNRYQGVVALDGHGLEAAAHQYFRQSEQIPTRIRLAVGEITVAGSTEWRAGGLFLQFLPEAPERMRLGDLDPGDAPASARKPDAPEDNAWTEAKLLADTVADHELLDPVVSAERLLYRLFHEHGVRVFEGQAIIEACRCSRERIMTMLRRFTPAERRDMRGDDGAIGITCEFCSTHYAVTQEEADGLETHL
jgi:molecular chaperone Hsp33